MDESYNRQSGWLRLPASNIVTFCQSRCCDSWRLRTLDTYYDQLKWQVFISNTMGNKPRYVVLVLERFCMTKLHLNWNFINRSNNYHNSTASTQRLPSSWERLDGLFLSIYFKSVVLAHQTNIHDWVACRSLWNITILIFVAIKFQKKKRKINYFNASGPRFLNCRHDKGTLMRQTYLIALYKNLW